LHQRIEQGKRRRGILRERRSHHNRRVNAANELRDQFAQDSHAVLAYFDALVELLAGAGRKH
jgi:hypothetical protein